MSSAQLMDHPQHCRYREAVLGGEEPRHRPANLRGESFEISRSRGLIDHYIQFIAIETGIKYEDPIRMQGHSKRPRAMDIIGPVVRGREPVRMQPPQHHGRPQ